MKVAVGEAKAKKLDCWVETRFGGVAREEK